MSRVRFLTAQALFEAYPELADKVEAEPTEVSSIVFLRNLSSQDLMADALTYSSYLLPRREAVWWACETAKALLGAIARPGAEALGAAELWVREPDEIHRQRALEVGTNGDRSDPLTWVALAAGWSGGMLSSNPKTPIPMPPYMTARAVRIAVLRCASKVNAGERAMRVRACVEEAIRLAETGL